MKERNFKLGDMDTVISDLGLDFYWTDFDTKETRHAWLNMNGLKELCKRFNMTDNQYHSYVTKLERMKKLKKISN